MLHGCGDRVRLIADQYLGHCSVTRQPLEQLAFLLKGLAHDPSWSKEEIAEVRQCVLTVLARVHKDLVHRDIAPRESTECALLKSSGY
jgi:hypothetical protein